LIKPIKTTEVNFKLGGETMYTDNHFYCHEVSGKKLIANTLIGLSRLR